MIQDAKANHNWNTPAESTAVLSLLEHARAVYVGLQK
jgi:hypothetical protein